MAQLKVDTFGQVRVCVRVCVCACMRAIVRVHVCLHAFVRMLECVCVCCVAWYPVPGHGDVPLRPEMHSQRSFTMSSPPTLCSFRAAGGVPAVRDELGAGGPLPPGTSARGAAARGGGGGLCRVGPCARCSCTRWGRGLVQNGTMRGGQGSWAPL